MKESTGLTPGETEWQKGGPGMRETGRPQIHTTQGGREEEEAENYAVFEQPETYKVYKVTVGRTLLTYH